LACASVPPISQFQISASTNRQTAYSATAGGIAARSSRAI
jgi:hypothetical protein